MKPEQKTKQIDIRLDETQMAAAMMVAEKLNAMSPEERNKPEVMQQMAKEAKELIETIRKRRLDLGLSARGDIRNWTAPEKDGKPTGGLGLDWRKAIPPTLEEIYKRRYLIAVNRVASGKVDDLSYSVEELADIADVMGAGQLIAVDMKTFVDSRKKVDNGS
jgi:hypothetical protein